MSSKPDDFDFPMSYNHYRSLCHLHGWHDPCPCEPPDDEWAWLEKRCDVCGEYHKYPCEPTLGKQMVYSMLDQVKAELTHVHNSLHELQAKKPKKRQDTYDY